MVVIGFRAASPTGVMQERRGAPAEQDRAGAALALTASVLASRQVEVVAQDTQQTRAGVDIDGILHTIDKQFRDSRHDAPPRGRRLLPRLKTA